MLAFQQLANWAEKGFAVLVLLLTTGALIGYQLQQGNGLADYAIEGDPRIQVMWSIVYSITFLLLVVRWKQFTRVATRDKLLLLLVGIALVSVLWSATPEVTLRRSIALAGTTLFGVYLATRYSLSEQLRLLAWALGIAALLSLVFALMLPSIGIWHGVDGEGWQGVFHHKNSLGRSMTLSTLVFLLLAVSTQRYRWFAWAGVALSVGLVVLSNSKTALVVFLLLLGLLPLYRALRWRYHLVVPFFIAAVLTSGSIVLWLLSNADTILDVLGKDVTLSGRTQLWSAVITMIGNRPWLGYGYSGFWLGREGESAYIWAATLQEPTYAHNGFLDLGLDLGLLGVAVFSLGFLLTFLRAVTLARSIKIGIALWPLTYLTFMLLYNMTEGAILAWNNIFWVLYVATTLSIPVRPDMFSKTSYARIAATARPRVLTARRGTLCRGL